MLNDYKGGKGGEQQTSMQNGKRSPSIFLQEKRLWDDWRIYSRI